MVNLKAKPFYLSDEDIQWVTDTIASMSDEEKAEFYKTVVHRLYSDVNPELTELIFKTFEKGLKYHKLRVIMFTKL